MHVGNVCQRWHRFDRQVEIGWSSRQAVAVKMFWRNPGDSDGLGIDKECAAHYRRVAGVVALPCFVAHDGRKGSALNIVRVREQPAGRWTQTECAEVVAGNEFPHHRSRVFLRCAATDNNRTISKSRLHGSEFLELR